MDIDVTKYEPVITATLANMKIPKSQRDDMAQECYVALLEKQKHLGGEDDLACAATICRSRIRNVWEKAKNQVKTDSMSLPRVYHKAEKVAAVEPNLDELDVTTAELNDAVKTLDPEEAEVIKKLFVEGKTLKQAREELGVRKSTMLERRSRALAKLRTYFEVKE